MAALKKKNPSVPFGRRSLPSVPAFAPGWDAFYLAIFCALYRCLALDGTRAGHADVEASRQNLVMGCRHDRALLPQIHC